jgi:hypothetical protein
VEKERGRKGAGREGLERERRRREIRRREIRREGPEAEERKISGYEWACGLTSVREVVTLRCTWGHNPETDRDT